MASYFLCGVGVECDVESVQRIIMGGGVAYWDFSGKLVFARRAAPIDPAVSVWCARVRDRLGRVSFVV